MTAVAAYLLLFLAVGIGFIFVHLMAGKFIRPHNPGVSKATIYECGEPTIGSAWIQFDLRFYVIALLFVIFDVEVAFFFPWAVVFGKANEVAAVGAPTDAEHYHRTATLAWELIPPSVQAEHERQFERDRLLKVTPEEVAHLRELKTMKQEGKLTLKDKETAEERQLRLARQKDLDSLTMVENLAVQTQAQARSLAWMALLEIAVFFGVLLVGFAYLWRRGDLAWVRSLAAERSDNEPVPSRSPLPTPPVVRQPAPLAGAGLPS